MAQPPEKKVGLSITSDPDTTDIVQPQAAGAQPMTQLPLRLLLVSDLAPQSGEVDWSGPSRVVSIDKHHFAEVMQRLSPQLTVEVPNRISDTPKLLEVSLTFDSLAAFNPEQIAQQMPATAGLFQIRSLVADVKAGKLDMATFRSRLEETGVDADWAEGLFQALSAPDKPKASRPAPSAKPKQDDSLDRLLGMVDVGGDSAPEQPATPSGSEGIVDAFLEAIGGSSPAKGRVAKPAAALLVDDLDRLMADQVSAVLAQPDFRRLEAAWRGLKFLVDRLDFRAGAQLEVLPASKAALSEALYYQVLMPEHAAEGERPPLSAIVFDVAFDNSKEDMALLADLAETGVSLQAPLLGSVDPAFFGIKAMQGLNRVPVIWQHLEGPAYIEWKKLRERPETKLLTLVLPTILLRYPYDAQHPSKLAGVTEAEPLWGGGALGAAALMAQRYARSGWPTRLREARLEDLPVWKSNAGAIPLGAVLSDRKQGELADAGFAVLATRVNSDQATLAYAPTVFRPPTFQDANQSAEARAHATLPCQLFVSRAAHFLYDLQRGLVPGTPVAQVQDEVAARFRSLMKTGGDEVPEEAVTVEPVADAQLPAHDLLAVRLRPPAAVLEHSASLVMGLQVPRAGA